jgi:hypothetical protein
MRRIINNKVYDTSVADEIASWSNHYYRSDPKHCEETLYLTKKGNWFVAGEGGPMSKYAHPVGNAMSGGEGLAPLTPDEAREWLELKNFVSEVEEHFGDELPEVFPELIHGADDNQRVLDVIAVVLRRIRRQDREELLVRKKVHFIVPVRCASETIWVIPHGDDPIPIHLVCLSPQLFNEPRSVAIYTVAHELSHAFLGHRQHSNSTDAILEKEREADRQVIAWGFEKELKETSHNYLFGSGIQDVFGLQHEGG